MKTFQSTPITFIDQTDSRKLEVYITSNLPTVQIFNGNSGAHTPDWREGEKLVLSMDVFLDSRTMTTAEYNGTAIKWYKNGVEMSDGSIEDISDDKRKITIKDNILKDDAIITYTCEATYQGIVASSRITFTRVDSGLNGNNGADGTSVNIKATASSVTPITGTDYYTITYNGSDISTAELNDAYMYNGDLYVCVDSRNGVDYFINVGRIQGPAGEPAKNIILTGSAQVFKVSKTNVVTPNTISVTAHTFNTSAISWTYSTNGGQTFLSTVPTGVSRNGNIVTVAGSSITSNSIVIKASDGTVEDVFTIYKAVDGLDGGDGDDGDPAPIAFLTNENVTFSANSQGQITGTTITSNVVAYNGTTKVLPTVGTPTGMPTGMTISKSTITASNEIMLTITIANNATLGSAANNMGTISIPVTSPVSAVLSLTWSKVNAGTPGVGISSTTVAYGVSDSANTRPADDAWQSTIPVVGDGKYLWTRTVIDYTDTSKPDTVTYSYAKQGAKGDPGNPGTPVTVSSIQYQEGASATVPPTGTWSTSIVAVADGKFLWTKTTFSDGKIAYGVAKQGNTGKGIKSVAEYYLASSLSEGVTTSTSGWQPTMQPLSETDKYLWNYELITYTDNTTATLSPVIIGVYGDRGAMGPTGDNAVTFQVYSNNGYALSTSIPTILLQTFAYLGDVEITAGATFQWYRHNGTDWVAVSGATNAYFNVSRDDVSFSNNYMCKMIFNGVEYVGVVTIDDKNDENKIFASKPSNYFAGDIWIVGTDYTPSGHTVGTMLRAEHTNSTYADSDWVAATKYDDEIKDLKNTVDVYKQYFSVNNTNGLQIGNSSINNGVLTTDRVETTTVNSDAANIETLNITGRYSGSTMLQAPILNLGNFSLVIESNGSLSIVANT
jgi:hypothetical protein